MFEQYLEEIEMNQDFQYQKSLLAKYLKKWSQSKHEIQNIARKVQLWGVHHKSMTLRAFVSLY